MPFAFNAVTLALVIGIVWLIALPVRRSTEHKRFWPALLEGLGWMRRNPAILRLAIMLGAINAVSVGGLTILVFYAQEVLNLSAAGYGILLACGAAGGVLGGIVAPDIVGRIGMRASLILALFSFIVLHLVRAFEAGFEVGAKPIDESVVEAVLSLQIDDLEPRLTRNGYDNPQPSRPVRCQASRNPPPAKW